MYTRQNAVDEHLKVQYLQLRLYNYDNQVVQCAKKTDPNMTMGK